MQSTPNPTCEFCGAPLERLELSGFLAEKTGGVDIFKPCSCPQAIEAALSASFEPKPTLDSELAAKRSRLCRAGIPERYWDAEMNDKAQEALCLVRSGVGVWMTGEVGRGKTHAACAVLICLMDEGRRVRFGDIESIAREVTASWKRDTPSTEKGVIDKWVAADVVVIDDMGAERLDATVAKILRAIISGREANDKVTIFTSNLTRDQFAFRVADAEDEHMGDRLASRIAGMTKVMIFEGEDRRLCHA